MCMLLASCGASTLGTGSVVCHCSGQLLPHRQWRLLVLHQSACLIVGHIYQHWADTSQHSLGNGGNTLKITPTVTLETQFSHYNGRKGLLIRNISCDSIWPTGSSLGGERMLKQFHKNLQFTSQLIRRRRQIEREIVLVLRTSTFKLEGRNEKERAREWGDNFLG